MDALATPADLAVRMTGVPDAARAVAALVDASATVRAVAGQTFTRETTTDALTANCSTVRLPQRPVNDVIAVTAEGEEIDFEWFGGDRITIGPCIRRVMVTYDHGFDETPDDVMAVICNVAARALASPPEDAGVMSRSITNYSESFGSVGAAGPAGLFNDERAILARYKRIGSNARLCRP